MLTVAGFAVLVTMALALVRGLLGPGVYDRVLAMNMFGTKTVLLVALVAMINGRPDFLDLALAYALINFIGVLAILQFVQNSRKREAREAHLAKQAEAAAGETKQP
jgi:multicomponent Na+:H+ antiporter subunit F